VLTGSHICHVDWHNNGSTLSDREWPLHTPCAISAVGELLDGISQSHIKPQYKLQLC